MSEQEIVLKLAEECLNEKGLKEVELFLLGNKVGAAKAYVLGAIDSLWTKKEISDDEAAEAYKMLGIGPEKASELRQNSPHWK